jgi:hypothetical protein
MSVHPKRESPGSSSGPASSSASPWVRQLLPFFARHPVIFERYYKAGCCVCALPSPAEKFLAEYII